MSSWLEKRKHFENNNKTSHPNAVLKKYLATMDLKDFSPYRFIDSNYLLNIELSRDSYYFDYIRHICPSVLQQYSLLELINQINFLASLPDFSGEVLFEYLKEVNGEN